MSFSAKAPVRLCAPPTPPALRARLRGLRHIALDMDGTLYRGGTLFPFTNAALARFTALGIGYSFVTNNCSKSAGDYTRHLDRLGIVSNTGKVHTAGHATLACLKSEFPRVRRVFLLGTPSLAAEFTAAGFTLTTGSASAVPDAVVAAYDPALSWDQLGRAAHWLRQGVPFLATHPDLVCPTDQSTVLLDCGSMCAALTAATGRQPDAIPGKPDPRMLLGLCQSLHLRPAEMAMIGDRLYTDVAMAKNAGALGVLVLSGEATQADADASEVRPDLIASDLADFADQLELAHPS